MTAFLDTKLLLTPFDSASPEKQGQAWEFFSAQAQRDEMLPSMQVLEGIRIVNPFRPASA